MYNGEWSHTFTTAKTNRRICAVINLYITNSVLACFYWQVLMKPELLLQWCTVMCSGLCQLTVNHGSSGLWTVYMTSKDVSNSTVCTQPLEIFGNLSTSFCTLAILWPPCKILSRLSQRNPLCRGLNARGVAKYSYVGHVEGYISEAVQDMASGTIND